MNMADCMFREVHIERQCLVGFKVGRQYAVKIIFKQLAGKNKHIFVFDNCN